MPQGDYSKKTIDGRKVWFSEWLGRLEKVIARKGPLPSDVTYWMLRDGFDKGEDPEYFHKTVTSRHAMDYNAPTVQPKPFVADAGSRVVTELACPFCGGPAKERCQCGYTAYSTPPGMEHVVKALKKRSGVENPWAVAWAMKRKHSAAIQAHQSGAEIISQPKGATFDKTLNTFAYFVHAPAGNATPAVAVLNRMYQDAHDDLGTLYAEGDEFRPLWKYVLDSWYSEALKKFHGIDVSEVREEYGAGDDAMAEWKRRSSKVWPAGSVDPKPRPSPPSDDVMKKWRELGSKVYPPGSVVPEYQEKHAWQPEFAEVGQQYADDDKARQRAASALDATHAVGERGPKTFQARNRVAEALDTNKAPQSRDVSWLEKVSKAK